jgi:hypothetical protein
LRQSGLDAGAVDDVGARREELCRRPTRGDVGAERFQAGGVDVEQRQRDAALRDLFGQRAADAERGACDFVATLVAMTGDGSIEMRRALG